MEQKCIRAAKNKKRTNFWFMIVINLFSIFHGKPPTYYTILIR